MSKRRKKRPLPQEEMIFNIDRLSHDGRGIARVNEKVTFVFGALPGEAVQAKLTYCHSRYNEAAITGVIKAAKERVKPPCDFFSHCGGCQLQHLDYPLQVQFKEQQLREQLENQGIQPEIWLPPLTSRSEGYRRKARLGVRYLEDKQELLIGFREQKGSKIARINACKILDARVGEHLEALKAVLMRLSVKKAIPQIEVAIADDEVALIIRHLAPIPEADLIHLTQFAKANAFSLYLQPKGPDSVHKIEPKDGAPLLTYTLPDHALAFEFHPLDFIQINAQMNQKMINQALELLSPQSNEDILDLFCGLGNFSLPFAQRAHEVTGVEGSEEMTRRAAENARRNHFLNVHFYAADLNQDMTHQPWMQRTYHKIILDPPRMGAEETVAQLGKLNPQQILYISCNPATFVRDAQILVKTGFSLTKVGVMDMFPHTAHVEVMGLFSSKDVRDKTW